MAKCFYNFSDAEAKTGGIEILTSEAPAKIYGLIGDSQSKVRRDFRIIGARKFGKMHYFRLIFKIFDNF